MRKGCHRQAIENEEMYKVDDLIKREETEKQNKTLPQILKNEKKNTSQQSGLRVEIKQPYNSRVL